MSSDTLGGMVVLLFCAIGRCSSRCMVGTLCPLLACMVGLHRQRGHRCFRWCFSTSIFSTANASSDGSSTFDMSSHKMGASLELMEPTFSSELPLTQRRPVKVYPHSRFLTFWYLSILAHIW